MFLAIGNTSGRSNPHGQNSDANEDRKHLAIWLVDERRDNGADAAGPGEQDRRHDGEAHQPVQKDASTDRHRRKDDGAENGGRIGSPLLVVEALPSAQTRINDA